MPNYKKHLVAGFATFLLTSVFFVKANTNMFQLTQWLLTSLVGSLFPDIDTKSKIQKVFYSSLLVLFFYLIVNKQNSLIIIFSFISLLPLIVNHRGIFHKYWFILLIAFSAIYLTKIFSPGLSQSVFITMVYFTTSAMSHLILDLGLKRAFKF